MTLKTSKIGIVRFLGTNCDEDVKKWVVSKSYQAEYLWFEDQFNINEFDKIIIPGGFSHGEMMTKFDKCMGCLPQPASQ